MARRILPQLAAAGFVTSCYNQFAMIGGPKGLGSFRKSLEAQRSEDRLVAKNSPLGLQAFGSNANVRLTPAAKTRHGATCFRRGSHVASAPTR